LSISASIAFSSFSPSFLPFYTFSMLTPPQDKPKTKGRASVTEPALTADNFWNLSDA
jgi:hypothetical protein